MSHGGESKSRGFIWRFYLSLPVRGKRPWSAEAWAPGNAGCPRPPHSKGRILNTLLTKISRASHATPKEGGLSRETPRDSN